MKFRSIFFTVLLFLSNGVLSQAINNPDNAIPIASFDATPLGGGSYTIPIKNGSNNITQVLVRIWGGGANGKTTGSNRSGGGGGAFVSFVIPASRLSVSRSLTITVGSSEQSSKVVHNFVTFTANPGNTANNNGGAASTNPNALYTEFISYAGGDGSSPTNIGAGGGSGKLTGVGGNGGSNYSGGQGEKIGFGTGGTGSSSSSGTPGLFPGGGGAGNQLAAGGAVYIYDYSTGALPVTLSNFTAKQTTDNKVALAWVTSSESVNKGFSIERQEEGSGKFQSLGFIASKAEGGNSQATLAYSFKDMTAKNGANMYRLVQEDLDGKKTYSEVRVVKLSAQSVSNVFPNPSNGAINISRTNDGKKMNIQVLDLSGRVISQVNNITDANYRMNLPQSGIYSIKMMYPETGEQSTQRIVVQK